GEPLLHPDLDELIRRIRARGMIAGLLTNGYLLTRERIERLNAAGLDRLQISIDNVVPNDVSRKSLKVLDGKLRLLAEHAEFDVNINSVVGAAVGSGKDAVAIAERARAFGFTASVGLVHDGSGQAVALTDQHRAAYERIVSLARGFYSHAHDHLFQRNLVMGRPNAWHCGAGGRYLYVCEDGLVHWCSQQRGHPAIPLERYGQADLDREREAPKSCAPYCTVLCVHRVALVDQIRDRPLETIEALMAAHVQAGGRPPATVRLLVWAFVTGPYYRTMRKVVARFVIGSW
ncbi:MAG TPA: radical SAM protein, partial [Vicinamibacterales bacterium]|nr:radical SAM protein [Vicinamibacterales bacterium]